MGIAPSKSLVIWTAALFLLSGKLGLLCRGCLLLRVKIHLLGNKRNPRLFVLEVEVGLDVAGEVESRSVGGLGVVLGAQLDVGLELEILARLVRLELEVEGFIILDWVDDFIVGSIVGVAVGGEAIEARLDKLLVLVLEGNADRVGGLLGLG